MGKIGIQVDGRIVEELSDRIPSNLLALNELLKNAYDAGASSVEISLDTHEEKLMISDTGDGMTEKEIKTLFHLAHSTKQYGSINPKTGRRIQGSKGLGFLSAFKFGDVVSWVTSLDGKTGKRFTVNINDVKHLDDINEYELPIYDTKVSQKGTTVSISLDSYNLDSLSSYFADDRYAKRILHCFCDDGISVALYVDGVRRLPNELQQIDKAPESALLYLVDFNSEDMTIRFSHKRTSLFSVVIDEEVKGFSLKASLNIYQFVAHQGKKVDEIYRGPGDTLYPLIYVNDSLFDNYDLFNPDALRSVKSSKALPQITGIICVNSDNKGMQFNSDRSKFQQNSLTDSIAKMLDLLNRTIQSEGARYKKAILDGKFFNEKPEALPRGLSDEQLRSYLNQELPFLSEIAIKRSGDGVRYTLFDNTQFIPYEEDPELRCADILLRCSSDRVEIPSSQINLLDYVTGVSDSEGASIDKSALQIKIDGSLAPTNFLAAISAPCDMQIWYEFDDPNTGKVIKELVLHFVDSASEGGRSEPNQISIIPLGGVVLNELPYTAQLVDEINNIKFEDYPNMVACSMRTVFELARDELDIAAYKTKDLGKDIEGIIGFVRRNQNLSKIANAIPYSYHTLESLTASMDTVYSLASLGTHKAASWLARTDIEALGIRAGVFAIIVQGLKKLDLDNEYTQ